MLLLNLKNRQYIVMYSLVNSLPLLMLSVRSMKMAGPCDLAPSEEEAGGDGAASILDDDGGEKRERENDLNILSSSEPSFVRLNGRTTKKVT